LSLLVTEVLQSAAVAGLKHLSIEQQPACCVANTKHNVFFSAKLVPLTIRPADVSTAHSAVTQPTFYY